MKNSGNATAGTAKHRMNVSAEMTGIVTAETNSICALVGPGGGATAIQANASAGPERSQGTVTAVMA